MLEGDLMNFTSLITVLNVDEGESGPSLPEWHSSQNFFQHAHGGWATSSSNKGQQPFPSDWQIAVQSFLLCEDVVSKGTAC